MKKVVSKIWTGNCWETILPEIAIGAQKAVVFENYAELVKVLSSAGLRDFKAGQSLYVRQHGVPDLWISGVSNTKHDFEYQADIHLKMAISAAMAQGSHLYIGHYAVDYLEFELEGYPKRSDFGPAFSIAYDGSITLSSIPEGAMESRVSVYPLTGESIDKAVFEGLANCKNNSLWTDSDKAKACETIGAIMNPKPIVNSVITIDGGGTGTVKTNGYASYMPYRDMFYILADASQGDTISGTGYFLVNDPQKPYHASNKKYVDDNTGMYLHTITDGSNKFTFSFQHPRSAPFDMDTLKQCIHQLMDDSPITSSEGAFSGTGTVYETYGNTSIRARLVAIGAMSSSSSAPLCAYKLEVTSNGVTTSFVSFPSSFTDYVTKL